MVTTEDINPFGNFSFGAGALGDALILFTIAIVIIALIGWLIYWRLMSKQYNKIIPLYKSINGLNLKQATYRARIIPISKAGDCLWFVKGINKFIAPANLTDAPNSFPHEEREDGEWINFSIKTVNEAQKEAGVKFIQQDMRTQRIATGQILEQRLIKKGFWEKYKDMIVQLIFYIVIMICMVVTFWQWGNIVEKIGGLVGSLQGAITTINELECIQTKEVGIVPAMMFLFWRKKKHGNL